MTKTLVIHTGNPETLFDHMSRLGTCFYCKLAENEYEVLYFATNRQVFFRGEVSQADKKRLQTDGREVKKIEGDDFTQEIRIEE